MASLAEVIQILSYIRDELSDAHRALSRGQAHANEAASLAAQLQGSANAELMNRIEATGETVAATAAELANHIAAMHEAVSTYQAVIQG